MRTSRIATAVLALCPSILGAESPRAFSAGAVPVPRFSDPERLAKLRASFPAVDRAFREHLDRTRAPGLAWGVVVDGALVHIGAAGMADLEARRPAGHDTLFRIASMTKSFTALAILKLRDEGRLTLDEPAARYVPELAGLRYPTRDSPEITLRHLLTHSGGFPEDNPWGDRQLAVGDATMAAWMRAGIPFSNAPGIAYEYSNYGFSILGQVVARVSGRRYRDYVDREILGPLGMRSSTWEAASVPADRLAHGYRLEDGRPVREEPLPDGAFGAMGGLYSSVADLARYVSFHLSAWPPRDDDDPGPVRRSSVREMHQAARADRASARRTRLDGPLQLSAGGYAYGLRASETCRFRLAVAHSGGLPGYGSQMRWLPEYGVGLVALANVTYAAPGRAITEALEAMAGTGALQPRVAQPAAALVAAREAVDRLLARWDDGLYEGLAASNLSLDRPRDKRRQDFQELRAAHGSCRPDGPLVAENALRGEWWLACERGRVRLSLTLAPTEPPRLQHLEAVSARPLSAALAKAAERLAESVGRPDAAASLVDVPGAAAAARDVTAAAPWGRCRLGSTREGGGDAATVHFACDQGVLEARLVLDSATGALTSVAIVPDPAAVCVP